MMGEMIGAIAHQWTQPLNALSLLISGLSEFLDETNSISKSLSEIKKIGMGRVEFMSETVNAFRDFFKPNSALKVFSIGQSIQEVSEQLMPHLKLTNIELVDDKNTEVIYGSENEFKQVILILLNNAYGALIKNKTEDPWIQYSIEKTSESINLHISDNAGGIRPEHLEHIFTPYFSSKEEGVGRGIGLYLAKLIIEEHFGGSIVARDEEEGACFTLTFKI